MDVVVTPRNCNVQFAIKSALIAGSTTFFLTIRALLGALLVLTEATIYFPKRLFTRKWM